MKYMIGTTSGRFRDGHKLCKGLVNRATYCVLLFIDIEVYAAVTTQSFLSNQQVIGSVVRNKSSFCFQKPPASVLQQVWPKRRYVRLEIVVALTEEKM
jgi:hypothetical protein